MQGQFLGQILSVAFNYAPKSWATCSAQLLSLSQNQALFSLLGTTYGGNGVNNFGLPDLRGRVTNSWGQGPGLSDYNLGQIAGNTQNTMMPSNVPMHTHQFMTANITSTQSTPTANALAQGGEIGTVQAFLYAPSSSSPMGPNTIQPAGSNLPFSLMQPYTVLQYCIALQGIFPSRN